MKKHLVMVWGIVMLSGCASMSIEECKTANWERVGETDGSKGEAYRLASHYKACQAAEVVPNQSQYEVGYQRGLSYYCTPQNIFNLALEGKGNYQHCPVAQKNDLHPYYQIANQYYQAKQQLKTQQQQLEDLQKKLLNQQLTAVQRSQHRREFEQLRRDLDQYERNVTQAEYQLNLFKSRINLP